MCQEWFKQTESAVKISENHLHRHRRPASEISKKVYGTNLLVMTYTNFFEILKNVNF
jgi:hypothetical protein